MKRIEYLPDFWTDVVGAAEWFDEQRGGMGREFVTAIDNAITSVARDPGAFRLVDDSVRRCLIRRFRFLLFFEVSDDRLIILGTVHGSRDVSRWLRSRRTR